MTMRIALAAFVVLTTAACAQLAPAPAPAPGQPGLVARPADDDPYVHRSNFVVADLDRAFKLYRDILGFKVDVTMPVKPESFMYSFFGIPREAKARIAFLSSPGGRFGAIGMTEVKGVALPPRNSPYPSVLIVEIQKRIEATREKALAAEPRLPDVGPILELTNPSRREFPVTDYDGHRIIVMQLHAAD
jgi:catechol 2,3-dioxygenase-like lactoylglutathione lyase family enzyme